MAWYAARHARDAAMGGWFWIGFAVLFTALLGIALYMALIDLRYTRLQYKVAERALYLDTLGSEAFRQEILRAQHRANKAGEPANSADRPGSINGQAPQGE